MKFSMYTQSLLRRAIRSCFATSQKLSSLAGQLHSFMFLTEWRWRDSNSWPPACKAGALPTELHPHLDFYSIQRLSPMGLRVPYLLSEGLAFKLMGLSGLEPPTSRLSGVRSNQLSYRPESWWRRGESNSWPPACKAGALPAELRPQLLEGFEPSKLNINLSECASTCRTNKFPRSCTP